MERRKKKTQFGNEFSFQLIDLLMDDKIRNKNTQSISNFFSVFLFFFFFFYRILMYVQYCLTLLISSYRILHLQVFSFLRCGTRPYVGKVAGRLRGKKTHTTRSYNLYDNNNWKENKTNQKPLSRLHQQTVHMKYILYCIFAPVPDWPIQHSGYQRGVGLL